MLIVGSKCWPKGRYRKWIWIKWRLKLDEKTMKNCCCLNNRHLPIARQAMQWCIVEEDVIFCKWFQSKTCTKWTVAVFTCRCHFFVLIVFFTRIHPNDYQNQKKKKKKIAFYSSALILYAIRNVGKIPSSSVCVW